MHYREVIGMLSRYFILLLLGFFVVRYDILYEIFTPLTVFPVRWILEQIYPYLQFIPAYDCPAQIAPALVIKGYYACIIDACVAGAAYFFLIVLNLATPMHAVKRMKSLSFLLATFLLLNVARITVFIMMVDTGAEYFGFVHDITWKFFSTILVVIVWFTNVWLFNISSIPGFTDIHAIWQDVFNRKDGRPRWS